MNKPHQPLAILSRHYSLPQLLWSTLEKEAFSTIAAIKRIQLILVTTDGFDLFTNHHTLIFLFDA